MDSDSLELELRPQIVLLHNETNNLLNYEDFSSYRKLRRRYYVLIRCFLHWKEITFKRSLSMNNHNLYLLAENKLFKDAQHEVYGNEINSLMHNMKLEKTSEFFKLSPYLDENNILRVNGRIDYAPDALQDTKRPIIMPPTHPVSRLIIRHYHEIYNHKNHETVVNEIRQKFSIFRLRAELKKVVYGCQHCKNIKAVPSVPEMAPLPPARLSSFTRPFTFTGIDYFGPITVIIGRKNQKRWCMLATCLTVRAIQLS